MGTKYVSDRSAIKVKLETTPGVYIVPDAVLPLEKGSGIWMPNYDKDESDPVSSHHGSKETTIITAFADVPVSSAMKLPSVHTLIDAALQACGLTPVTEAGYVAYAYDSTNKKTLSLLQVSERKTTAAYGARGDFSLTMEVGKSAEVSFDFKSLLSAVTQLSAADADNAVPGTPTFDKVYMTKDCTAYLVNGNSAHFKKVVFNLGADIKIPKDTCAGACYTQDIKPELQVLISVTEDNEDAFDDLKSGTQFNFVIPLFDANGVKKWELIAPKCVVIEQKTPDNEGRLDADRTFECRKVSGDDNFELRCYTA